MADLADLGGDEEAALDIRGVHALQHRLQADAFEGAAIDADLVLVEGLAIGTPGQRLLRPDVHHRVDRADRRRILPCHHNPISRATWSRRISFAPSPKL